MFDRETWRFINSFAWWLSALGTIAAVVVALRLARRSNRIDLRIVCAFWTWVDYVHVPRRDVPGVVIIVTNQFHRSATVKGLSWSLPWTRKSLIITTPYPDNITSKLPVTLEDGEEANYFFPIESFDTTRELTKFATSRWPRRFWSRRLRINVWTSSGDEFSARVEREVCDWLWKRSLPPKPGVASS